MNVHENDFPDDYWIIPSPEQFENQTLPQLLEICYKINQQIAIRDEEQFDMHPAGIYAKAMLDRIVERTSE